MMTCKRGHEYVGANLYVWNGRRYCRACRAGYAKTRLRAPYQPVVNPKRPGPQPDDVRARLMRHAIADENRCLIWKGSPNNSGYGSIRMSQPRRTEVVHRASYEAFRGPIPVGMHIDHLCRVRLCIEPTHLEVVTPQVNMHRSNAPAAVAMRRATCKNGHPWTGTTAYFTKKGSRVCRVCHREDMRARYQPRKTSAA